MSEPAKPAEPAVTVAPASTYGKSDSILFQAWLVLFLLVICFALVNYLVQHFFG